MSEATIHKQKVEDECTMRTQRSWAFPAFSFDNVSWWPLVLRRHRGRSFPRVTTSSCELSIFEIQN